MLQAVETGSPPSQPKWSLRESLLQDILAAIANARSEQHFGTALVIALESDADLRHKIRGNRTNGLIAHKYILGYLPEEAKSIVGQFISDTLRSA